MSEDSWSVGKYLASRLVELDVRHYFTVPGDYNLILLDEFLKIDGLEMVSCCNELNAGYAADGVYHLLPAHADAVVGNGDGSRLLVHRHPNPQLRVFLQQAIVGQGLESQLLAGVRRIGYQLA